jgi:hypothetical protein
MLIMISYFEMKRSQDILIIDGTNLTQINIIKYRRCYDTNREASSDGRHLTSGRLMRP